MKKIIVILSQRALFKYLKNINVGEKYSYIAYEDLDHASVDALKNKKISKLDLGIKKAEFVEPFLNNYINLMGTLARNISSLKWWLYSIASKDYYSSNFFTTLLELTRLITDLEDKGDCSIILIKPPRKIILSLRKYCSESDISFTLLEAKYVNSFLFIKRIAKIILLTFRFLINEYRKILISRFFLTKKFKSISISFEKFYVLRTWLKPYTIKEKVYRDEYFGPLPEYLQKHDKKVIILAGIRGDYKEVVRLIAKKTTVNIYPQEFFLKIGDPLRMSIENLHNHIRFKNMLQFCGIDISDLINKSIDEEYENAAVLRNYCYHFYSKRLLERISVSHYVLTHENYPWEKVSIATIRKYAPKIRIIGYQHSPLYPALTNIYLDGEEKKIMPFPDIVVTLGKITRDFLLGYCNYDMNKVKIGCALRFNYVIELKKKVRREIKNILVVLGGRVGAIAMIDFVMKAFKNSNKYTVILRFHPNMSQSRYRNNLNENLLKDSSILISDNKMLESDLDRADVVLYDVSAAALKALGCGKPLIHVNLRNTVLDFDSLINCRDFKWKAKTVEELNYALSEIEQLSDMDYFERLQKAKLYFNDYCYEVNEERMRIFLTGNVDKKVGLPQNTDEHLLKVKL